MIKDRLLYGDDEMVARFVQSLVPNINRGFGQCSAIGVLNKEETKLIAGVVYSSYQPELGTIQLSIASKSKMWAHRDIIKRLLDYPFYQLNCFKLWTSTSIRNKITLKTIEHIGFRREAVLAHQLGRKHHAVICRLLRPEFIKLYEDSNG